MIGAILAKRAVAAAFEAMNQHDLKKFMSIWRDDALFVYPGEMYASGIFRGKAAIESWFRQFFNQFPSIRFDLRDICVRKISAFTGNNTVIAHWNVYLTNREGRVGENSGVTVITVQSGKVIQVKDFIFDLGENFLLNWSAEKTGSPATVREQTISATSHQQ